jgi:hypothetical protein
VPHEFPLSLSAPHPSSPTCSRRDGGPFSARRARRGGHGTAVHGDGGQNPFRRGSPVYSTSKIPSAHRAPAYWRCSSFFIRAGLAVTGNTTPYNFSRIRELFNRPGRSIGVRIVVHPPRVPAQRAVHFFLLLACGLVCLLLLLSPVDESPWPWMVYYTPLEVLCLFKNLYYILLWKFYACSNSVDFCSLSYM